MAPPTPLTQWLDASLQRMTTGDDHEAGMSVIPIFDAMTGLKVATTSFANVTSISDELIPVINYNYLYSDMTLSDRKRLWALLCGLRGSDDNIGREALELRVARVMDCGRSWAVEIALHILAVRSISAGRVPYMADAPPLPRNVYDNDTLISYANTAIVNFDSEDAHMASQKLVDSVLNYAEEMFDDVDDQEYLDGTNDDIEAECEAELADVDFHTRRPEFLAQAHVDEKYACDDVESLYEKKGDLNECSDEEELAELRSEMTWVAEHESRIRPAQFAELVTEIGQGYMTDTLLDDRALGLLYDASMHFLEGLFDASAANFRKRKGCGGDDHYHEDEDEDEDADADADAADDDPNALQLRDLRAAVPEKIRRNQKRGHRRLL